VPWASVGEMSLVMEDRRRGRRDHKCPYNRRKQASRPGPVELIPRFYVKCNPALKWSEGNALPVF
jgi:hypothetical protein